MIALTDVIGSIVRSHREYGNVYGICRDNAAWVFVYGPKHNHTVLTHPEQFQQLSFILFDADADTPARRLDAGLITMNGSHHKQQRRLMMPALHKKHVETYRDQMVSVVQTQLDSWYPGMVIDIHQAMTEVTLRIVTQTLFGTGGTSDITEISIAIKHWMDSLFNPRVLFFPFNVPGTPYARSQHLARRLEANIRQMIASKRADPAGQRDVLAMLLHARDDSGVGMTDNELIGHASILFTAGHETSANALTWALFLLEQHPAVLADLLDELEHVLGGEPPSVDQLAQLPLLERVVKETLRLLPPICLYNRACMVDWEFDGVQVPAGARLSISQYITHRIPEIYAEPQRFLPQRWETIDPTPYEYFPFGAGQHTCIGFTFALMELKIILAMLVQRYRFSLLSGAIVNRQFQITLAPAGGMPMRLERQDRQFRHTLIDGNLHAMVDLPLN